MEVNEEWNNFMHKINEVTGLVRDMASGDKRRSDAAKSLADQYLKEKDLVLREGDDVVMRVKSDRTVINRAAFQSMEKKETGETDKEAWMREVGRDADKRAHERKVRRERADTLNTQAIKAFRRAEYDRALSCYNRAIEQVRDNPMLYCDRALTNIKLRRYHMVFADAENALRLNENSFKARLYKAKAHQELGDLDKLEESRKELGEMFPQHADLVEYFLNKRDAEEDGKQDEEEDQ